MNQGLLKVLKIFLIIAAALLVIAILGGISLLLDWPWWVAFYIAAGLIGLMIGFIFFRKIWQRKREQHFVHKIIEQDDSYLQNLGEKEKENLKELQHRWKEAIRALKQSHLKRSGNPLYVLPWYMIIGESGSGKTTAIQSANLASPFTEISRTSGISGTRNCDWWFFEQAILIDTAGRYAVPVDEGKDKEEWQNFLTLLVKFRKKEPLNGLVVTIAADKLIDSTPEILEDTGLSIRRRVDELMRVLGTKFPVYILVTKCDLILGMTQFCDHLPDSALQQAMGVINQEVKTTAAAFLDNIKHTLGERLKDLRLILLHQIQPATDYQEIDPGLILFPEEFEKLKAGLDAFFKGAFQENPYQETPVLRGAFFSSGRQEGSPYSHFLKELGLVEERDVLPGTSKGLFLHDFFSKILPKDRKLFAPTQRMLEWSKITRNLGLTAWIALIIALCGLMSFSFVKNLKTLRDVSHEFSEPAFLQGDILEDVIVMDRFRRAILNVQKQNRNWWFPRFGLNESKKIETKLKEKFCNQFQNGFLAPFDKRMETRLVDFSSFTEDATLGKYCIHFVRRINLLKARLAGQGLEVLRSGSQPSFESIISGANKELAPEIKKRFEGLYLYYLIWQQDAGILNLEVKNLAAGLKHLLTIEGTSLNWLASIANSDSDLKPVYLQDFWALDVPDLKETEVPEAFTVAGKKHIDRFIKEMEAALFDPLIIASKKLKFHSWYTGSYIKAWYAFGTVFPKSVELLKDKQHWQQVLKKIAAGHGPYQALLTRMGDELEPFHGDQDVPEWVNLVFKLKKAKQQALVVKMKSSPKTGLLGAAAGRLKAKASEIGSRGGLKNEDKLDLESKLIAAKAYDAYQTALQDVPPVFQSRKIAFQAANLIYSEDTAKSPFFAAHNSVESLKSALSSGEPNEQMVWSLLAGPFSFTQTYVVKEASCHLQTIWEKDVLLEMQGAAGTRNINRLLFGQSGYVSEFIKSPAANFLDRNLRQGYFAKKILGQSIPFNSYFLSFLSKGSKAAKPVESRYSVSIKGLPTHVNIDAQIKPHATRLEIQCTDSVFHLINLHYPIRKTLNWSPGNCNEVVFKIEVGNLVLTKKYTGYYAFPKFLKDFPKGTHVFYPGDFPEQRTKLRRIGIKHIKVKYKFKGDRPVVNLLKNAPGKLPQEIVKCWD
jgi:type VI secretion system protein ImpL